MLVQINIMKEGGKVQVLFLVLNETKYLDDILAAFVEVGVKGATILDSQGMGSALALNSNQQIPLFGYLKNLLDDAHPYNKTIFTVLKNEELTSKVVKAVKDVVGDIDRPGVGFMFTIPVGNVYGIGQKQE